MLLWWLLVVCVEAGEVLIGGGYLVFGTSFADEDEPSEFAPVDEEGEKISDLKESLGDEVFSAIAGATGLEKRPSSLSKDGALAARHVKVDKFWMDATAVSNDDFKKFSRTTKYVTEAEKYRWSFVLELLASKETIAACDAKEGLGRVQAAPWWLGVFGATWRRPEGPDSSLRGRGNYPAVHMSWNDAQAYCTWAGKRLPTEMEWEYAARGGLEDDPFPWGHDDKDAHKRMNFWQGAFPKENLQLDGYLGTAPVDAYEPNDLGIYNSLGNVWEWTQGGAPDKRPLRGGSYVDSLDGAFNHALRVSTRMDQTPDSGSANTGFRCARTFNADLPPDASSTTSGTHEKPPATAGKAHSSRHDL